MRLRKLAATHTALACKLDALEEKYDAQFKVVFDAIRELMAAGSAVEADRVSRRKVATTMTRGRESLILDDSDVGDTGG